MQDEDPTIAREKVEAHGNGTAVGALWAAEASSETRERVFAYANQELLDEWSVVDDHTILEVSTAGALADDKLTDVQTPFYVVIHGPGKSLADDQADAEGFWNSIAVQTTDTFWLNFYVGFVEGVASFVQASSPN